MSPRPSRARARSVPACPSPASGRGLATSRPGRYRVRVIRVQDALAGNLRAWRRANGYTHQQVADALGVSQVAVTNWANGKRFPRPALLVALARLMGVPPCQLVDHALH